MTPDRYTVVVVGVVLTTMLLSGPVVPGVTFTPQSAAQPIDEYQSIDTGREDFDISRELAFQSSDVPTEATLIKTDSNYRLDIGKPAVTVQTDEPPARIRFDVVVPALNDTWSETVQVTTNQATTSTVGLPDRPVSGTGVTESSYDARLRLRLYHDGRTYTLADRTITLQVKR
jgi:hypothetical protein